MLSILLVEPHADTRELYAEFLQHEGFQVFACDDTDEALARASTTDVVVTGIRVNGTEDGLGLVRHLRGDQSTSHLPIIVLSACAFESDEREALEAGCTAYLSKPCLPVRLADAIRAAVGREASGSQSQSGRMAKAPGTRTRRRKRA